MLGQAKKENLAEREGLGMLREGSWDFQEGGLVCLTKKEMDQRLEGGN